MRIAIRWLPIMLWPEYQPAWAPRGAQHGTKSLVVYRTRTSSNGRGGHYWEHRDNGTGWTDLGGYNPVPGQGKGKQFFQRKDFLLLTSLGFNSLIRFSKRVLIRFLKDARNTPRAAVPRTLLQPGSPCLDQCSPCLSSSY